MKKVDQVKAFIGDKGIVTVEDICCHFTIKEPMARRYLQQVGASSSMNFGSSFYILPDNHEFMDNGLLCIDGKVFSQNGNLIATAVSLVESSSGGMCISELFELLQTSVHSQLPKLVKAGELRRAKVAGVGTYIYLGADLKRSKQQLKQRRRQVKKDALTQEGPDVEDAFNILVAMIKNPEFTAKEIAASLQRCGRKITSDGVKRIVSHFDISKKNF